MDAKIKTTVILLLLNLTGLIFAQQLKDIKNNEVEGLYVTLADFKSDKITRLADMQHEGDKIKLNQFFVSAEIVSIEQDRETIFYKDSIFAIRLTNGEKYRYINGDHCLIADTSYLYIYTDKTVKIRYKRSGPRRIAKEIPVTYYYFSKGNQQDIYLLSLENLHKFVLSDPLKYEELHKKFTTNEMLNRVNSQTGRFELNELLESLIQN